MERTGDVFPSQNAMILKGEGSHLAAEQMRWGFPGFEKGKLLINARAESVLERRTFQDSVQHRRCIIPARGLYEWNKSKEKDTFERRGLPLSGKKHRFCLWQGAITGMRIRKDS